MNRFFHMMRLASSVIKSRGFAVSVLAVLMSLTVYAVSSTTNTVYIRADQQTTILTTSQRDLDAILEECGISVSQHDTVDFSGFDGDVYKRQGGACGIAGNRSAFPSAEGFCSGRECSFPPLKSSLCR